MQKPTGYDEAQASGEYVKVDLGGHYCQIKQVSEVKSKSGRDMIVVLFDFCSPDKQDGYFTQSYDNDTRPNKKWPFNGSKYIMVNDYEDPKKTSRQFKTFCTCVEKSNNFEIQWGGSDWSKQFRGKKIGAVYGEEENEYDGRTFMRRVAKWFCTTEAVADARIPEPKYLNGRSAATSNSEIKPADNGFMTIPEGFEEEIPF